MTMKITDAQRAMFFKKAYERIDGLWFMKIEEESGFDHALEIDRKVWEIVPKIQARTLREIVGLQENGLGALEKALRVKAELDEADIDTILEDNILRVHINRCPWYELMLKANRKHLAERVGRAICGAEYPTWMREFGVNGEFRLKSMLCADAPACEMEFEVRE